MQGGGGGGSEKSLECLRKGWPLTEGPLPHRGRVTKGAGVVFLRKTRATHIRVWALTHAHEREREREREEPLGLVSLPRRQKQAAPRSERLGARRNADATRRQPVADRGVGEGAARGDENGWINADVCVSAIVILKSLPTPTALISLVKAPPMFRELGGFCHPLGCADDGESASRARIIKVHFSFFFFFLSNDDLCVL